MRLVLAKADVERIVLEQDQGEEQDASGDEPGDGVNLPCKAQRGANPQEIAQSVTVVVHDLLQQCIRFPVPASRVGVRVI
jgi:hypothetical protein